MTLVLGFQNEFLTGPVVASAAAAGLGADQLQNDQGNPATAWQTPAGTLAATLSLARDAATLWRAFALCRTNLSSTATVQWTVRLGGQVQYTGTAGRVVAGFGQAVLVASAAVAGDALEVDIADPNNPDGFLSIPLAYAGAVFQPVRNYGYDSAITNGEGTVNTVTRAGSEYIRNDWQQRGFDLTMNAIQPGEVPAIVTLDAYSRRGSNVFFAPDPTSANINREAVFGRAKPTAGIGFANNFRGTRTYRTSLTERL